MTRTLPVPEPMNKAFDHSDALRGLDIELFLREQELTYYHESGHAVSQYFLGLRPKWIKGALTAHDRRTTSFCRAHGGWLRTSGARERAENYAVSCIAGIAAEAKVAGTSIADLRYTSGEGDYQAVHAIADRVTLRHALEICDGTEARIRFWESRAVAMMNNPFVWRAVESLVVGLYDNEGVLYGNDLIGWIEDGLRTKANNDGVSADNLNSACSSTSDRFRQ